MPLPWLLLLLKLPLLLLHILRITIIIIINKHRIKNHHIIINTSNIKSKLIRLNMLLVKFRQMVNNIKTLPPPRLRQWRGNVQQVYQAIKRFIKKWDGPHLIILISSSSNYNINRNIITTRGIHIQWRKYKWIIIK